MDVDDNTRYFIVASVFMEIVAPLFRKRLENKYKSSGSLQDFFNSQPVLHLLFHLRNINAWCCTDCRNCIQSPSLPITYPQWKLLYTENPIIKSHYCHCRYTANSVKLCDLDITLCSLILLTFCNLTESEEESICLLRKFNNEYLSHNTTGTISEDEYNALRTDLATNVLNLDPSKHDDLIRIEKRPLDDRLCTKYCSDPVDIHKKLDEVHTTIDGVNETVQKILSHTEKAPVLFDVCKQEIHNKETRKPYRLGHDIFTLHHQYNLTSVLTVDRIGSISGGVMMDDDRLVLCIWDQKRLLICNTDGSEGDSIPLQSRPYDVTAVNNSTVAVTLLLSNCIEMYNINNKQKLKSISVPGRCIGITTINNKLVVGCERRLLVIDDQTGEVVHTVNTDCRFPARLHTTGDRIFYCDHYTNHNLYCYNYNDDRVTTLTLPSHPHSITSLQDGSLYVVCDDGSVQHVSSDVQHYKTMNTKGLKSLASYSIINYNPKQRKLMVCNGWDEIKIFNEI